MRFGPNDLLLGITVSVLGNYMEAPPDNKYPVERLYNSLCPPHPTQLTSSSSLSLTFVQVVLSDLWPSPIQGRGHPLLSVPFHYFSSVPDPQNNACYSAPLGSTHRVCSHRNNCLRLRSRDPFLLLHPLCHPPIRILRPLCPKQPQARICSPYRQRMGPNLTSLREGH